MLIISKITHKKNSLIRKLHSHYEAGNTCKFLIVKGFEDSQIQNRKNCGKYAIGVHTAQIIIVSPFDKKNLKNSTKENKPPP